MKTTLQIILALTLSSLISLNTFPEDTSVQITNTITVPAIEIGVSDDGTLFCAVESEGQEGAINSGLYYHFKLYNRLNQSEEIIYKVERENRLLPSVSSLAWSESNTKLAFALVDQKRFQTDADLMKWVKTRGSEIVIFNVSDHIIQTVSCPIEISDIQWSSDQGIYVCGINRHPDKKGSYKEIWYTDVTGQNPFQRVFADKDDSAHLSLLKTRGNESCIYFLETITPYVYQSNFPYFWRPRAITTEYNDGEYFKIWKMPKGTETDPEKCLEWKTAERGRMNLYPKFFDSINNDVIGMMFTFDPDTNTSTYFPFKMNAGTKEITEFFCNQWVNPIGLSSDSHTLYVNYTYRSDKNTVNMSTLGEIKLP